MNDLTSMVKKKKKPPVEANGEPNADVNGGAAKRKAEDDESNSPSEKKARLEEAPTS